MYISSIFAHCPRSHLRAGVAAADKNAPYANIICARRISRTHSLTILIAISFTNRANSNRVCGVLEVASRTHQRVTGGNTQSGSMVLDKCAFLVRGLIEMRLSSSRCCVLREQRCPNRGFSMHILRAGELYAFFQVHILKKHTQHTTFWASRASTAVCVCFVGHICTIVTRTTYLCCVVRSALACLICLFHWEKVIAAVMDRIRKRCRRYGQINCTFLPSDYAQSPIYIYHTAMRAWCMLRYGAI